MRVRVPYIPQMEAVECGAASLAMVLAYHGHHAPLSEVRHACGISRDGSTAKNIVVAARTYGLVPRAQRLEPADLDACDGPAILHWEMNHFVVLEKWTPKGAFIADPGMGRRFVSSEVFDGSFTGICLQFTRGEAFVERKRERASYGRYLALLRGAGRSLAMVLFASLALDALATVVPLTTQVALDHVIGRHRVGWLGLVVASALGLVTFSAFWSLVRGRLLLRVSALLDVSITRQFVKHLLDLPVQFFAQRSVADLLSRVQSNRTIRDVIAGQAVGTLADGAMLLAYLGVMFAFDARLSVIVLGAAVVYVVAFLVGGPIVRAGADEAQRSDIVAAASLLQILRGITTIKSAGVERSAHRRWLNAWIASLNAGSRVAMKGQTVGSVLFAIQLAVPIAVLFVGGQRVLDGELTPGHLVGFQMLQAGFLGPLQNVVEALLRFQIVPVLLGRMDDVLLSDREPAPDAKCPRLEGAIELRDVTFRYSPTAKPVLSDVSMTIPKGAKVALVGPSGSGKSTLARLLLGLYSPTSGTIELDGNDISKIDPATFRRQYGVVLQETALFDGTVADNLRLFYANAPLEHVVQAARVAQIHDDILALPNGYETKISASSGALSGGQRQRLALARAIVHRPPIMVLDEATSALDAVTEAAIERYLSTRACTRIVIAHRLSTVRDADTIFVLDGGRIVEQGRHDDLVAAGGLYTRLSAGDARPRASSTPPPERIDVAADDLLPFAAFREWPARDRADLARHVTRVELGEATRVVEQDARATGLYLVIEGEVAVELAEPGLAAWTVATLGAGELFGDIGLLDGSPASASVVARSAVRLLHLPYTRFEELRRRGDTLAVRATLALGAIVAKRMRDAIERHATLAAGLHDAAPMPAKRSSATRELALNETLLGATLDADEVEAVERLGTPITCAAGSALFTQGDAADTVFLIRAGRVASQRDDVGVLDVADAGALVAERSLFDASTHATSAVAVDDVVALAIRGDALRELLVSGKRVAPKLLAPITEALVRRFRLTNFRLREVVARTEGELDRAHAARERALEAAREEREALQAPTGGRLPMMSVKKAEETAAACFASWMRANGRPVSLASLVESFASAGEAPAIVDVARSMGIACRPLEVPLTQLRAIDAPILALVDDGVFVVLERRSWRGWHVMDPLRGWSVVAEADLAARFSGRSFELRNEATTATVAPLPRRVGAFARSRLPDLARLVAITVAVQGLAIGMSLATALAVGRVFPFADRPLLGTIVSASVAVAVALVVSRQLQGRAIEHLRAHFDRELFDQMMTHVLRLPIAFFDRFPPGEVLQRFQSFESVRLVLSTQGVSAVLSAMSLLVGGVLLVVFAPALTLVAVAVLVVHAIVARLLFPPLRRAAAEIVKARAHEQDRLIEMLGGIVTLRMAGDRSATLDRWSPPFMAGLTARLRQDGIFAAAAPALEWVRGVALVACVGLGTRSVLAGSMSAGALVAFLGVLATFLDATHGLALQVLASAPSFVSYDLVRDTFRELPEQTSTSLLSPGELRGKISLDQVSFRYTADGPNVLEDVSLDIESGMKVALVGPSGSGKSTLGRLLLGLYLPSSGRIAFDDKDVTGLDLEALRRRMGVVLQDPFLLSGSIRENIGLGAEGASVDKIVDAAQRAAIHDDIQAMAMGYETLVSEGGAAFSGGQRQRMTIARALVSSPAVLLLDEATSALDNLSQAVIERHLGHSSATRVVIAHRLSTVVDADRIVVLKKGRIVEQGTHDELVARGGVYLELVRAQM